MWEQSRGTLYLLDTGRELEETSNLMQWGYTTIQFENSICVPLSMNPGEAEGLIFPDDPEDNKFAR